MKSSLLLALLMLSGQALATRGFESLIGSYKGVNPLTGGACEVIVTDLENDTRVRSPMIGISVYVAGDYMRFFEARHGLNNSLEELLEAVSSRGPVSIYFQERPVINRVGSLDFESGKLKSAALKVSSFGSVYASEVCQKLKKQ